MFISRWKVGRGPLEQDPHLAGPVMPDDEQAGDAGASAGKDATAGQERMDPKAKVPRVERC